MWRPEFQLCPRQHGETTTYIGDSDVGKVLQLRLRHRHLQLRRKDKFRTTIGDYCFIGCNTNLVAPIKVGDGAYTAAGSTILRMCPHRLRASPGSAHQSGGWAEPKMEAYIAKKQKLEADQNK